MRFRSALLVALLVALATPINGFSAGASTPNQSRADLKIVSLSPTATEMLFAIGAGDQVVAADEQSNYPSDAPVTDLSGIDVNAEAIAGYEADLVVAQDDTAKGPLGALGIDLLVLPAANRLTQTYAQIRKLGKATGHVAEATALVKEIKSEMAGLRAEVPERDSKPTAFYELDDTLYSATSKTFIGQLLKQAGFRNIADAADKEGSGYPQLSAEYIVDSDPEVIFLADSICCGQTPETVAARPGFDTIAAVQQGNVVTLDDDIASRWGPRVVELFRAIVKANQAL
ncbi:MAG TPA: ABC transporter substrate-binding protein [Acidimicrobiia bacterium]|nr:ABC transporter substrate-binding protein [Acidimicrobiia bacterium]